MSDVKIRPVIKYNPGTGDDDIVFQVRFKGIKADGYTLEQAMANLSTIMNSIPRYAPDPARDGRVPF